MSSYALMTSEPPPVPPLTPREAALEIERMLARALARKHHAEELQRGRNAEELQRRRDDGGPA